MPVAIPFHVRETDNASPAARLFKHVFGADPPAYPRHFIAVADDGFISGYIHFTEFETAVYLCGGLCIDRSVYRRVPPPQRSAIAQHGSLSRWLIDASITALGAKRAVFAYTGDTRSRRDAFALGFVSTASRFLLVQWHDEPQRSRDDLVRRIEANGPF